MKKIVKISLFIGFLGISGVGGYYGYEYYQDKKTAQENENQTGFNQNLSHEVVRQDLISSVNFSGNTKIKNQQKLKFPADTKIVGVYKIPGDSVKSGELLAEIDKKNILTQIEILKINYLNAELKLKKVRENNTDIEIKRAQIEYEKALEDLKNKKDNLVFFQKDQTLKIKDEEKSLEQKKLSLFILQKEVKNAILQLQSSPSEKTQSLTQMQNKLKTLEIEYERDTQNFDINLTKKQNEYLATIEKEYLSIQTSLNSLGKTFQELDVLFRIKSNQSYEDDYLLYFSAKNGTYKNNATHYMQGAYAKFLLLEKEFLDLKGKYTIDDITRLNIKQIAMYEDLYVASDNFMKGLDNSIAAGNFDEGKISSFYGIASSLFSEASTKKSTLKHIEADLKNLKTPAQIQIDVEQSLIAKKDEIDTLKLSIQRASQDLDLLSSTLDDKIQKEKEKLDDAFKEIENAKLLFEKNLKNQNYDLQIKNKEIELQLLDISQLQKKLKDLLDVTTNQELVSAENDLKQAKVTLENEQAKLKDYELRAPFDGLLTKVDYKVGDNIGTNDEKVILIENPDILEVSIFADQVDITKLKKGQKSLISYDAFPGVQFDGEIIEIDATPQDKDGVTKYEVKIFVKKGKEQIFSGMMANVNIVTQEKKQVLSIPFTALKTDESTGETYVSVVKTDGNKEKRKVVAGYNDGINTEIIEGLEEGEKVLEIDYDANTFQPQDFEGMGRGF